MLLVCRIGVSRRPKTEQTTVCGMEANRSAGWLHPSCRCGGELALGRQFWGKLGVLFPSDACVAEYEEGKPKLTHGSSFGHCLVLPRPGLDVSAQTVPLTLRAHACVPDIPIHPSQATPLSRRSDPRSS